MLFPLCVWIDETFEAQSTVPFEIWNLLNAHSQPIWKVCIGNHFFYVSKPFTRNHHYPVGCDMHCFVAVDCETLQKCVLKDVWRVISYHPEGEVYTRLHQHSVVNIPGIIAGGNVDSNDDADGSHSAVPLAWAQTLPYHLGEPISDFCSTWELTKCILDAIKAHCNAFSKAEVEHHDISPGNIIIVQSKDGTATGNLIDWNSPSIRRMRESGHMNIWYVLVC
ncbi:hypothetical protein BT96DRAFT_830715 [Gymnopus androsaceus JB14]|uniref:Fungal-type protein kinase domain-containing protein n=1 Tax=Gymnopus androsaceus JB14 TaxID=1447944 RepID=A0A6A4H4Y4_9AGAR|nr:hypothetical protein BT96DRAFT_830715 [Gymnopus androsaceus JB14]